MARTPQLRYDPNDWAVEIPLAAEWYYIGHYGEIGPLEREQIEELIDGGVITTSTYVWRAGMTDWIPAERVPELQAIVRKVTAHTPPPLPGTRPTPPTVAPPVAGIPGPATPSFVPAPGGPGAFAPYPLLKSDKSRIAGGILQLVIPGVGRIYLGYAAIGVLQLLLSLCGVGVVWAWIDGVIILAGGVRLDGYGRELNE